MLNCTIARKGSGAIIWSEDQIRYIIKEYTEKDRTLKELSKEFSVQSQSIRNLLRKHQIVITNKKTCKYPRNSNYFEEINTHDKAYWLGIMLSDGSVTNNSSINLGLKDREHIEKFRYAIGAYCHKIIEINDDRWNKPCINYRLSVKDKKMEQDLSKYGVVHNKSYIQFGLPGIPEELYYDFIRGYFDGDGSIYYTNNRYVLSFVGNKQFLTELKYFLGKDKISLCQNSVSKITYDLKIIGEKNIKPILEKMYENSNNSNRLERKFNIAQKILSP